MLANNLTMPTANAQVQSTLFIQSTTGGDGITWTAALPGDKGNNIGITYLAPAGATTTVSVTGPWPRIVVQPKAGETNTGLLAAVVAATTVVTGVVTVGGDLIIASAEKFLTGGVTGVAVQSITAADAVLPIWPGMYYEVVVDTAAFINVDAAAVVSVNKPMFPGVPQNLGFLPQITASNTLHTLHVIGTAGKLYLTPIRTL